MHRFFRGEFFNFEAVRILGTTRYGGAEIAEFLEAVGKINENDPVTWQIAWSEQATKAETLAEEAETNGHRHAVQMAYLRASNYTRASAYMMTGTTRGPNPQVVPILKKTVELFRKAMRFMECDVHILRVPHDQHFLSAYLYVPAPTRRLKGKTPVLVNSVGADSMQEEIYYMFPAAGPDLGYAVLTYEGPGQGLALHEHHIPMRPDWEDVNKAVIDFLMKYAEERPELQLDLERIAVGGASLGGYFALRSAVEPRIKACIAIDPVYDLLDFATKHVSPTFLSAWDKGWITDWFVDSIISIGTKVSFQMRWEIATAGRFLGAVTPSGTLKAMKEYTLRKPGGTHLDDIKCPVFVSGAANSLYLDMHDHTTRVFRELKTQDKEIWLSQTPGQGSLQAKMGAMGLCNQRAFQFLDKYFGIER